MYQQSASAVGFDKTYETDHLIEISPRMRGLEGFIVISMGLYSQICI
jgi:hypothetical protein